MLLLTARVQHPCVSTRRPKPPPSPPRWILAHSRQPRPPANPRHCAQPHQIQHRHHSVSSAHISIQPQSRPQKRSPLFAQQQNRCPHQEHYREGNDSRISKWVFHKEGFFTTRVGQPFRRCPRFQKSIHLPVQHRRNLPHLARKLRKLFRQDRLHPVRQRLVRLMMHFHQHPIRSHGNRRPRERQNLVPLSSSVRWIDQNRQMAPLLHRRHNRHV